MAGLGSNEKRVLAFLFSHLLAATGAIGIATLLSVFPNFPIALDLIRQELNADRRRKRPLYPNELRRLFEQLRRERLIDIIENDAGLQVSLKRNGIKIAIVNHLDQLRFERPKHWDGIWWVVMFDIPEPHKQARDAFVRKLKELNFYPLQKSIFVFPYAPHDLIDFLSEIFHVSPYIRLLEANKIDGEEEILAHFELRR